MGEGGGGGVQNQDVPRRKQCSAAASNGTGGGSERIAVLCPSGEHPKTFPSSAALLLTVTATTAVATPACGERWLRVVSLSLRLTQRKPSCQKPGVGLNKTMLPVKGVDPYRQ